MSDLAGEQLSRSPGSTPAGRDWSRWRIPMTALVLVTFAFTWVYVPRGATTADLARDLAAGEVVRVDLSPPSGQRVGPTATIDVGRSFAPQIWWETIDGRTYQAPASWLLARPGQIDLGATVSATAEAAGHPAPEIGPIARGWQATLSDAGPLLLWVLLVALLVVSPPPRRMTRWAVFWLLPAAGGLGALWWLWWDAPWSPAANRLPDPTPGDSGPEAGSRRRVRGWLTFVIALVANVAASAVLVAVFGHFYAHPGSTGPVEWSVVDPNGTESTWVQR